MQVKPMIVGSDMQLEVAGRAAAGDKDFEHIAERPHVLAVIGAARGNEIVGQISEYPKRVWLPAEAHRGRAQIFIGLGKPGLTHDPWIALEALCGGGEVAMPHRGNL